MTPPDYICNLLAKLPDAKPAGTDEWMARCPAHDDRQASLSIGIGEKGAVLHCHANCDTQSILTALNLSYADLYPPDRKTSSTKTKSRIVATYPYVDAIEKLLYEQVRFEPKNFRQRRPSEFGGYEWSLKGVERVLYRLPEVLKAIAAGETIYLVEGEKDVDNLRKWGLVATCNAGGAGKWLPAYTETLRGAKVVMLPDNDGPGRKHRDLIASKLPIYVLELPGLPEKGDVSDWIEAGGTKEEFLRLVTDAVPWNKYQVTPTDKAPQAEATETEQDANKTHWILPYSMDPCGIVWDKSTKDKAHRVPLTNFSARIVAQVIEDDGAETRMLFEMVAERAGRKWQFSVPASAFATLNWAVENLGAGAIIWPGQGTKDHVRAAIQHLSGEPPSKRVFRHIGWREVEGGKWVYLHGCGGIGASLPEAVSVSLDGALSGYVLPVPPIGEELRQAVLASLNLFEIAPDDVSLPSYAALWRSVLDICDFSVGFFGPTQSGKSTWAALLQQHFGAGFHSRNLPGAWTSTDNALEGLAFACKDALLVIDDYVPKGSATDVQRLHAKAERVLRAQGNNSGRQRMRADGTLRPVKHPRGLIISTGEDIPPGESLRARMLILELAKGDLKIDKLSECQRTAATGIYAQAMAGFLNWLAPQYAERRAAYRARAAQLLTDNVTGNELARMPDIVSQLIAGFEVFLDFCREIGALSGSQSLCLMERAWNAIWASGKDQNRHQSASEPAQRYIELLKSALSSGKAFLKSCDGKTPCQDLASACGWQERTVISSTGETREWQAHGDHIGWIDETSIYLLPVAAYNAVKKAGDVGGDGISISDRTLRKRLSQSGLLAAIDATHKTSTVRKTVDGVRHDVLHLSIASLIVVETPQSPQSPQSEVE